MRETHRTVSTGRASARLPVAAALLGLAAAGCVSEPRRVDVDAEQPRTAPVAAPVSPFDGSWRSSDGLAVSSLRDGGFVSTLASTGERLTQGSYTIKDSRTIDLSFFSVKSKQNSNATCLLVSPDQLNCTSSNGTNFVLARNTA